MGCKQLNPVTATIASVLLEEDAAAFTHMWPPPVASRSQILTCGVEPDVQCYTAHADLARQLVLGVARLDLNLSLSDMQENAISQSIMTWINRSATPIYSPGGSRRPDYALYCVPLVRRGSRGRQRQGRQGRQTTGRHWRRATGSRWRRATGRRWRRATGRQEGFGRRLEGHLFQFVCGYCGCSLCMPERYDPSVEIMTALWLAPG